MIIMDYHLLFIAFTLLLLIIEILLLFFVDLRHEEIFGTIILCGINWLLSLISLLGFFGIFIPFYDPSGNQVSLELIMDMWPLFAYFLLVFYMNIAFIYYAAIKWMKVAMNIKDESVE